MLRLKAPAYNWARCLDAYDRRPLRRAYSLAHAPGDLVARCRKNDDERVDVQNLSSYVDAGALGPGTQDGQERASQSAATSSKNDGLDDKERARRAKISAANSGRIPWNKGRNHTPGKEVQYGQACMDALPMCSSWHVRPFL